MLLQVTVFVMLWSERKLHHIRDGHQWLADSQAIISPIYWSNPISDCCFLHFFTFLLSPMHCNLSPCIHPSITPLLPPWLHRAWGQIREDVDIMWPLSSWWSPPRVRPLLSHPVCSSVLFLSPPPSLCPSAMHLFWKLNLRLVVCPLVFQIWVKALRVIAQDFIRCITPWVSGVSGALAVPEIHNHHWYSGLFFWLISIWRDH